MVATNDDDAALGMVLVTCAGMATVLGAAVVFNTRLVHLASERVLAAGLGLSAGVMLYVSFVEIFVKSQSGFEDAGLSESDAYLAATGSFFLGVLVMHLIDKLVHYLDHQVDGPVLEHDAAAVIEHVKAEEEMHERQQNEVVKAPSRAGAAAPTTAEDRVLDKIKAAADATGAADVELALAGPSSGVLLGGGAAEPEDEEEKKSDTDRGSAALSTRSANSSDPLMGSRPSTAGRTTPPNTLVVVHEHAGDIDMDPEGGARARGVEKDEVDASTLSDTGSTSKERLARSGLLTALALGLHNFPEGIATFVATLSDPSVGIALAVAIAAHNIPEGLCVSVPIYYATGSRWRGFGWACLSGASEPVGAGLAWLVLYSVLSDVVYGILFGFVAGMMVMICLHELLPTAHRYDPNDKVTTLSTVAGMVVMAASLVLFLY